MSDADPIAKPPRARVSDAVEEETVRETFERKRDYLDGFLKEQPKPASPGEPGGALYEAVIDALKDIYDLGLIYRVEATADGDVSVTMTLTTPHCPVAESMPGEVELRVGSVPGVRDAEVNLVWDPPWGPDKMTDEARLELGML
jgi:metal-sulfur cluster biosynthetic enzyme